MKLYQRLILVFAALGLMIGPPEMTSLRAQSVPGLASIDRRLVQYAQKTLTNAQVLAIATTPVTIIPAQGAGTVIEPLGGILSYHYSTAAYTIGGANDLKLWYTNHAVGPAASAAITVTGFLDQTADKVINFGGVPANEIVTVNAPIVLQSLGVVELGGGNASDTLTVRVAYRVHNK